MRLITSDSKRVVDVGGGDIWFSVYSTIEIRLKSFKNQIPEIIHFFKTGKCSTESALETARQFNLLRDELSKYTPDKAVYNMNNLSEKPPWENDLSPVVTSCGNLYTTADGKDLLFEIVSILTYPFYAKVSLKIE